jgi:hypothetical protein
MPSRYSSTRASSTCPSGQPCSLTPLPEASFFARHCLISVIGSHVSYDHRVAHRRQGSVKSAVKKLA